MNWLLLSWWLTVGLGNYGAAIQPPNAPEAYYASAAYVPQETLGVDALILEHVRVYGAMTAWDSFQGFDRTGSIAPNFHLMREEYDVGGGVVLGPVEIGLKAMCNHPVIEDVSQPTGYEGTLAQWWTTEFYLKVSGHESWGAKAPAK
jgi:hypothetical protein